MLLICEANSESGYWAVDTSKPDDAQHINISDSLTTACLGSDGNIYAAAMNGSLYKLDPITLLGGILPGSQNVGSYAHGSVARPDGNNSFITYWNSDYDVNLDGILQNPSSRNTGTNSIFAIPCGDGLGYFTSCWTAQGAINYVPYDYYNNVTKTASYPGATGNVWGIATTVSGVTYACSTTGEVFEVTGDYGSGFALSRLVVISGAFLAAISGDALGNLWVAGSYTGDETNPSGWYLFKIVGGGVEFYPMQIGTAGSSTGNPNCPVYMVCGSDNTLWIADRRNSTSSYLWQVSDPTNPKSHELSGCHQCWEMVLVGGGGSPKETISSSFTTGTLDRPTYKFSFHTGIPEINNESFSFHTDVVFPEVLSSSSSFTTGVENPGMDITTLGTVLISTLKNESTIGTSLIRLDTNINTLGTVCNNVLADNLMPITIASSVLNASQPTLILEGDVIYSNPTTMPPNGLTDAKCYVGYACNALFTDKSLGNFFSWNLSIDGGKGSWNTKANMDWGTLGDVVYPFGLTGFIREEGREKTTGSFDYIKAGLFGTRNLNKPVAVIYNSVTAYTTLFPSQSLGPVNPARWTTYGDAARCIAAQCIDNSKYPITTTVGLNWAIVDYPVSNLSFQAGQSGIEALVSLAESVGAKLRWNGSTQYTVKWPDEYTGTYTVPSCRLIRSMSSAHYLDLRTGLYNPGIYMWPRNPGTGMPTGVQVPIKTKEAVGGPSFSRNLEQKYTTSKMMTSEDPPLLIDLPMDYEDVYIKIVTTTDGDGQYVTFDPTQWFLLNATYNDGSNRFYINYNDVLGVLQPQIRIDHTLFPQTNTDLLSGHFNFIIGISRKTIGGSTSNNKQTVARTYLRYQFLPIRQYNVSCVFSGALPLPGMRLVASIDDFSITAADNAIIEHVDFSNPGIIGITAIQWARIEYYSNYLNGAWT